MRYNEYMVERIPIWCSDNNNNFNNVNKMRLESDVLREAINDCGSMIRKYQNDETKKDIRGFWWEQVIKLTKQRKKVLKQEHKDYKGKSSGPGGISFLYGEGNRQAITYQAVFPEEKDFYIFPAWLKHWVAPFRSDVERVSVSGNIASHIPFKDLKPPEKK